MDSKVVVISGAASGIGEALCHLLAERGTSLGMLDYDRPTLKRLTDELRRKGVRCFYQAVDVRERHKVVEAIRKVSDELGPIDILISSAGICRAATIDYLDGQEFEKVVLTNLMGTVSLIEATIPSMLARGRGHIIGISSLAGIRGIPYEAGYAASKAAVAAYLESIRYELKPRGVSVTTVFPGYVQTPLLEKVNSSAGADMSNGKACTASAAAVQIMKAIERKKAHVYFPWTLGFGVRLSRLLSPSIYDWVMRCAFGHLRVCRINALAGPAELNKLFPDHPVDAVLEHNPQR